MLKLQIINDLEKRLEVLEAHKREIQERIQTLTKEIEKS